MRSNTKTDDEPEEKVNDEVKEVGEEYKEKYFRALADYQNLEKQTQSWKEEFVQYANLGLVEKLLEVLDDLEKAQEHIKDEGLQLVINKLKNTLRDESVGEVELEGKEYDPKEAEAVSTEAGEEDNIVTRVLQKGYSMKDKIIRPGKVIVSIKS
ncbi:MAG: Protein GrpE [Microgenomates group bacterium GW2011_GWA1_48_10]|uniref:Protein GrpE n=1 Tax=Candidatus Gottesmanbacteria bacterium RIFCSPHIGHO2_01_FULL_47_48 TaxID=1798381 RepID=A0A1F6A681_9BACT|nr:MAG: Protein GrpE [Microgenomates group bacterium GW2011_GWA1_48_10]OGG19797.1 MAG: nucleotide exchange factor GrpE [Candidatus Gottesmanbacteria bacterium RIFCSPHIGHO2_01_FULL_47_48]